MWVYCVYLCVCAWACRYMHVCWNMFSTLQTGVYNSPLAFFFCSELPGAWKPTRDGTRGLPRLFLTHISPSRFPQTCYPCPNSPLTQPDCSGWTLALWYFRLTPLLPGKAAVVSIQPGLTESLLNNQRIPCNSLQRVAKELSALLPQQLPHFSLQSPYTPRGPSVTQAARNAAATLTVLANVRPCFWLIDPWIFVAASG